MLRCTIEILPGGSEERKRIIGCVEIANTGGDAVYGNYTVVLKKTPPFRGALKDAWRKGLVKDDSGHISGLADGPPSEDNEFALGNVDGHHRTLRGSYDLLYRALKACGLDKRNP